MFDSEPRHTTSLVGRLISAGLCSLLLIACDRAAADDSFGRWHQGVRSGAQPAEIALTGDASDLVGLIDSVSSENGLAIEAWRVAWISREVGRRAAALVHDELTCLTMELGDTYSLTCASPEDHFKRGIVLVQYPDVPEPSAATATVLASPPGWADELRLGGQRAVEVAPLVFRLEVSGEHVNEIEELKWVAGNGARSESIFGTQ